MQKMYVMMGMELTQRRLSAERQLGLYSDKKKTYAGKTEA
jgi:hypothetical protein